MPRGVSPYHQHRGQTVAERLAYHSRVDANGCRIWISEKAPNGYGRLWVDGRKQRAHRLAWEVANGPIPDGMQVCHHCDVRTCIEVSHLFLGTNADNVADKVRKGRQNRGETSPTAKLSEKQARAILADSRPHEDISRDYGIAHSYVRQIKGGQRWRHLREGA